MFALEMLNLAFDVLFGLVASRTLFCIDILLHGHVSSIVVIVAISRSVH